MLCRVRTRILGPSNRALLSRIETLGPDSDASSALIERLDATMRYVAEKTSREAEERIAQRVERLDDRLTEIAASVEALRKALEAHRASRR